MLSTSISGASSSDVVAARDEEHALGILTRAFMADPPNRWVWLGLREYLETFPAFARALGGRAFEHGTAERVGNVAVALWLPPGVYPDEEALASVIERTVAPEIQADLAYVIEQMGSFHPAGPHWYLPLIGVDPAYQGSGYGSALLAAGLARCDRDRLPAYLESTSPRNLPLYERHGFELVTTIQVGECPPIFPMVRPPR